VKNRIEFVSSVNRERVKELLSRAVLLPPHERAAFIRRAAGDDVSSAEEAIDLLATLDDTAFMSAPTGAGFTAALPSDAPLESAGTCIGRYKLLQLIGEGGFGSVFMAEQTEPVHRRVALKIIKAGMDTRQVIARFEAERQALALMDHPHIARVLDAGATDSGRPYFVMELVRGEPVTAYCDRHRFSVNQRLELFRGICNAVEHAHQKGIIHRDLKPSNILVSVADGQPLPKVIDFGIAKATGARLTDKTLFTEVHQLIGTLEYMSPEQAEVYSVDVDTRSDIYALGVLLYELLVGSTPLERGKLGSIPIAEIQRRVREEPAPRPSLRLATLAGSSGAARLRTPPAPVNGSSGSSAVQIAQCRRSQPWTLTRALRGDLDWIVLKCLEKDRRRRYATASALAEDIGRYLLRQPVLATPPSAFYKVRTFIRRHRAGVAVGSILLLALAVGLGASVYGLQVVRHERDAARTAQEGEARQRRSAERVADFMGLMLEGAGPEVARGRDATMLRQFLEQAVARIDGGELRDAPEAETELRITIANVFRTIGDTSGAERVLEPVDAMIRKWRPDDARIRDRYLEARSMLLSEQSRFHESVATATELLELRRRLYGPADGRVALTLAQVGADFALQGRYQEALETLRQARTIAEECGDDQVLANVLTNLADPLRALGLHDEAVEVAQLALDLLRRAAVEDTPLLANALNNLAAAIESQGEPTDLALEMIEASIEMKRRLYPQGHPDLGISINNLAFALQRRDHLAEAEARYLEALDVLRPLGPSQEGAVAMTMINLSTLAGRRNDPEARESYARQALEICRRVHPGGHLHTANALINLGVSLRDRGMTDEGFAHLLEAVEVQRRVLGPAHGEVARTLGAIGNSMVEHGRFAQAVPVLRETLTILGESGEQGLGRASALAQLAAALLSARTGALADIREAELLARESLGIRQGLLPPHDWRVAHVESIIGAALVDDAEFDAAAILEARLARLDEAEPLLTSSFETLLAARDAIPAASQSRVLAAAADRLSRLYSVWDGLDPSAGKRPLVEEWRERAQMLSEPTPDSGGP